VVSVVKYLRTMVTLRILACVVKERQVVFNLSKEMGRYMDDVACCCLCVPARKQKAMRERHYMFFVLF
jgi:hypothetical protein